MERLTGSDYSSLVKAYSAVYNDELREKINEEKQVNEFLELINALVEEGYDLSEYTYDELYESYINEGLADAVVKGLVKYGGKALQAGKGLVKAGWKGTTKIDPKTGTSKFVPGAEQSAKGLAATVGRWAVPAAAALGVAQWATGKVPEYVGAGINALRTAGHNLPSPGEAQRSIENVGKGLEPYVQDPRQKREKVSPPSENKPKKPSTNGDPLGLKDNYDPFDLIKGHLMSEGYADSEEAAIAIMSSMSEEWRQSIIEQNAIVTTGTSTNAAGEKIPWTHRVEPSGRRTVKDRFGERELREPKLKGA